jgi:hypothetical protein
VINLISLHIPRTAGTTFYQILEQVYGEKLSISYRRRDVLPFIDKEKDSQFILPIELEVLHGHFYYSEIKQIHLENNSNLICWLRDPIDRLISNYQFFIHGLRNPQKNPKVYKINKNRINESLLEFAQLEENRNRMSKFLDGINIEDLYFFGIVEYFKDDIIELSKKLNWPKIIVPHLNSVPYDKTFGKLGNQNIFEKLKELNSLDIDLYNRVLKLKKNLNK